VQNIETVKHTKADLSTLTFEALTTVAMDICHSLGCASVYSEEINLYQDPTAVTIFCELCIQIKNILAHVVLVAGKQCISKFGNDLVFRKVLII